MDERDFIAMNKAVELEVSHNAQIVSFADIDNNRDLYTYYFEVLNGKIRLHSIDKWVKNGKSGNTYKHEEIFHHEYKKKITNYKTGEFEEPNVPNHIWKYARRYLIGFIASCL